MKKENLINPHLLGIFIKEVIERSSSYIRKNRYIFEAKEKINTDKKKKDFVTNIDTEAQEIVVKLIQECYPGFGIIAEESDSVILLECTLPPKYGQYYFTVDPLDGTSAFTRMQSDGIGSMLSLVRRLPNEKEFSVIAVCIADVMTGELYYFRPESNNVHRLEPRSSVQRLSKKTGGDHKLLKDQYCLLRNDPRFLPEVVQKMTFPSKGLFNNIEVNGGSIGTCVAKLWKRQVGAIILEPGYTTPWDWDPIYGISSKLGYKFFYVDENGYNPIDFGAITNKHLVNQYTIIIHAENEIEFSEWMNNYTQQNS